MNRGLLHKSFREILAVTLLCGLAIMAFEILIAAVLSSFQMELAEQWLQIEFMQQVIKALLGAELGDKLSPGVLRSIAWVHPVILALLWAHEITICTRLPAAEVDRGTIDILFGLPVSRSSMYLTETFVWICGGLFLILMGLVGALIGNHFVPEEARPSLGQMLVILSNLFCLYLAVGAMALLVSALSNRRGRAVAVAFGVVLGSFFLNFLTQFWEPAQVVAFLGILNYYQPLLILREASWPVSDMAVLLGCALAFWSAGMIVFTRRDICTV